MSILLKLFKADKYQPPAVLVIDYEQKLKAAKERLGTNWVLHPNYVYNPKHRIYRSENGNQSHTNGALRP